MTTVSAATRIRLSALAVWMLLAAPPLLAQFMQDGPKLVGTGADGLAGQGGSVAVSADGNRAIVGGSADDSGTGAAWIFVRTAGVWVQEGEKLVATGAAGALQGVAVDISGDGNTVIIGGIHDNGQVGAAWIFTRVGGVWVQQEKLVGSGAVGPAIQGISVALSFDGNTALVGGFGDNNAFGAAWVFTRVDGAWTQQGPKLVGSDAAGPIPRQGESVDLSFDGNTAIIGGPLDNGSVGAAWVFTRTAGVWSQQGPKLVGTGITNNNNGHLAVALSGSGNTAMIGRNGDSEGIGAAWVFERSGVTWTQQGPKLVGTGSIGSPFQGTSVSLSSSGNQALIGGFGDNFGVGAAWLFARTSGIWSQQGEKLVGADAVGSPNQGGDVALSGNGTTALSGGPGDSGLIGATWVFVGPSAHMEQIPALAPANALLLSITLALLGVALLRRLADC